jgi:tetratricopeptide (TPR) repeat protein
MLECPAGTPLRVRLAALMPSGPGERHDFFLSRRGSVAAIAREVTDVLTEKGYRVLVQDYDFPLGTSFVEAMHEGIKNSRDLVILYTQDYESSPYTRKEFTSFTAQVMGSAEERHVIILRCEDLPLEGLLADNVYQDLVGVQDPDERKHRIIAAAERQSQAAPPPPRPFIGVPPRIASFTGRADELDRLDAILMRDEPAAVTQASVGRAALHGMGGVGKTALAIEYAHRFRGLYAGVCWCPAETRTGFLSVLATLAVKLGAATAEEADVEKAAKAALRRLTEQRATWLLIYDNVAAPDEIADLLPSAGARVLITSRFSDWSELADEVALDLLPPEQAVALLESRTGRRDAAGAKTLAEAVGRLPLALDHAAAYCKRTQMRFADYAAKASSLMDAAPRGAGYPKSVAVTFDLAIAEAVAHCPSIEGLMAYLAQCAPERIPMALVEGAVEDEAQRLEALATLAEVSLVKHDPFADGTPAVSVHRLVQAVARARSNANGSAQDAVKRLIARLVAQYPKDGDNPQSWPLCAQLTPHLMAQKAAAAEGMPTLPSWPILLSRAGSYIWGRGFYKQAASFYRDALEIREKTLNPEHPDTAANLNDLGFLLQLQGDLTGARPLLERALAIREKVLGPEDPDTARSLSDLGLLLQAENDLTGARPLLERALAIREKKLDPEHPETARSLHNLARLLRAQGDLAGARPLLERALAIRVKVLGLKHPDTARSFNNLGQLLQAQGDLTGARRLLERALAIREEVLGAEHSDTAGSLFSLAQLLQAQGDFAAARLLFERALAINEKTLGPEHRGTNETRSNLARLLLIRGQPTEALILAQTAMAAHDKVLGPNHPWTRDSARVTADALDALGRTEEAKALRERYGLTQPEKPTTS